MDHLETHQLDPQALLLPEEQPSLLPEPDGRAIGTYRDPLLAAVEPWAIEPEPLPTGLSDSSTPIFQSSSSPDAILSPEEFTTALSQAITVEPDADQSLTPQSQDARAWLEQLLSQDAILTPNHPDAPLSVTAPSPEQIESVFLNEAIDIAAYQLEQFQSQPEFTTQLKTAFGPEVSGSAATRLFDQWLDGSERPRVEILNRAEIGGRGAYAERNNTIYLAREVLLNAPAEDIAALYLEELGHAFDAQLNPADSPGDEGAIFAALVQGQELSADQLTQLQSETDTAIQVIGDETLAVEHQNGTGLKAIYYDNRDFSNPVLERTDAQIDFDWQQGSPDPAIGVDDFSIRWEGQIEARYSEDYTFYTQSDDGIRVTVNGQVLIDNWTVHASTEDSGTITLVAGQKYDIKVEYFEAGIDAHIKLFWESASQVKEIVPQAFLYAQELALPAGVEGNGTGLKASYYNNIDFSQLVLERTDAQINFDWQNDSPDPALHFDHFSVRWSGQVEALYSEAYTFYTQGDEGIRVTVNGQVLIDNWTPHGWTEDSGTIALVAGQKYDIKVEYFEHIHGASLKLLWSSANQVKEVIPTEFLYAQELALPTGVEGNGTGLLAKYYDNKDFSNLVLERTDAQIDFDWHHGSPDPQIQAEDFSVRWTGQIEALYSEAYTFYAQSDEAIRVTVNGQVIIDHWTPHGWTEDSGTIALVAGQKYDIQVEYLEGIHAASVKLLWSSASQVKEVIPQDFLYAQELALPPGVAGNGTGLKASYYNDIDFSNLVLERTDAQIDFDWAHGSPDAQMHPEEFSVRWSGQVEALYSEAYTFYTQGDEGIRVTVNGQVLIDNWTPHGWTEDSGTISLIAGQKYNIKVEYFEHIHGANIKLLWSSASQVKEVIPQDFLYAQELALPTGIAGNGNGLKAEYFDNKDFTNLVLERTDAQLDFNWHHGSPDSAIHPEDFSVRWTGQIEAQYNEEYTFYTQSDEGIRVWVNNQLLIDHWHPHGWTEDSGRITLAAGQKYDIRVEYYEGIHGANIKLLWSSASQVKAVIPQDFLYSDPVATPTLLPGHGLTAQYFDNRDFSNLVLERVDAAVDFNWWGGTPDQALQPDEFSVRWTGQNEPPRRKRTGYQGSKEG